MIIIYENIYILKIWYIKKKIIINKKFYYI